jgi:hypothetical protein
MHDITAPLAMATHRHQLDPYWELEEAREQPGVVFLAGKVSSGWGVAPEEHPEPSPMAWLGCPPGGMDQPRADALMAPDIRRKRLA